MFKGIFTALITPFRDGAVDWDSLEKVIADQVRQNVTGFVVAGTTGEAPTLRSHEVEKIFQFVKERAGGRKVIVGTGSNSTELTLEKTEQVNGWGADAALVVVPYYNKPTQAGLKAHFLAVAEASKIPCILYDVPSRTVVSMTEETILELASHPNITGLKDATGDMERHARLLENRPEGFSLLSGDDGSAFRYIQMGGDGVISVSSHIIGAQMMTWLGEAPDQTNFDDLFRALALGSNPMGLKKLLNLAGTIHSAELRLPLVEIEDSEELQRVADRFKELT